MFDMTKLKKNMADSFMYHGTAARNKRDLELEVCQDATRPESKMI